MTKIDELHTEILDLKNKTKMMPDYKLYQFWREIEKMEELIKQIKSEYED